MTVAFLFKSIDKIGGASNAAFDFDADEPPAKSKPVNHPKRVLPETRYFDAKAHNGEAMTIALSHQVYDTGEVKAKMHIMGALGQVTRSEIKPHEFRGRDPMQSKRDTAGLKLTHRLDPERTCSAPDGEKLVTALQTAQSHAAAGNLAERNARFPGYEAIENAEEAHYAHTSYKSDAFNRQLHDDDYTRQPVSPKDDLAATRARYPAASALYRARRIMSRDDGRPDPYGRGKAAVAHLFAGGTPKEAHAIIDKV